MGIFLGKLNENMISSSEILTKQTRTNDEMIRQLEFVFPEETLDSKSNGSILNGIYLPEEILILILSFLPMKDIMRVRLVCKKWYNLVKINTLWSTIYFRKYKKYPKHLPWYLFYTLFSTDYFSNNLLKNNCGDKKFDNWIIIYNGGNKFKVEEPSGSEPLPLNNTDFENNKTCFVTSYDWCIKIQKIDLTGKLINLIINKYKPSIHISEWVVGRFDCGGHYILKTGLYSSEFDLGSSSDYLVMNYHDADHQELVPGVLMEKKEEIKYDGGLFTEWKKIEITLKDYPENVDGVIFQHGGIDNQFWRGHYGPKMSGGVVKLSFDSIKPLEKINSEIESEML